MHDYIAPVLPAADSEGDVRVNLDGMVRLLLDTYPNESDDKIVVYFHPEDRAQAAGEVARLRKDRAETRRLFDAGELPEVLFDLATCSPEEAAKRRSQARERLAARGGRDVEHEQIVCVVGLITNEWGEIGSAETLRAYAVQMGLPEVAR